MAELATKATQGVTVGVKCPEQADAQRQRAAEWVPGWGGDRERPRGAGASLGHLGLDGGGGGSTL